MVVTEARIYYCGPHEDSLSGAPRWQSYVEVMEEAGLKPALLPVSDVSAFEGTAMEWPGRIWKKPMRSLPSTT